MDFNKRIQGLTEAIERSDVPNKEDLRNGVEDCVSSLVMYFSKVVDSEVYYTTNISTDSYNCCVMDSKETEKRLAMAAARISCVRLNEICRKASVPDICDFDTGNDLKITKFCGLAAGSLYFADINCRLSLGTCFSFADTDAPDSDVFTKVYADGVTEKFNKRFTEIKITCEDARIEWDEIFFVYTDSKGDGKTLVGDIDVSRLNEYGYIGKRINETYLCLVSIYERKGIK
jgi:hypothetical protein